MFGATKPVLKTTVPCDHLPVRVYYVPRSGPLGTEHVRIHTRCRTSTKNVELDPSQCAQLDPKVLETASELAISGRASLFERPTGVYYCSPVENADNLIVGTLIAFDTSSAGMKNLEALL